jgi:hypothetical protein
MAIRASRSASGGYYDDGYYGSYGGGYGGSYYGWYGDYYYPGTGYYVYDRYRHPHRWNDTQRAIGRIAATMARGSARELGQLPRTP